VQSLTGNLSLPLLIRHSLGIVRYFSPTFISVSFNGHFPGGPGLAGTRMWLCLHSW